MYNHDIQREKPSTTFYGNYRGIVEDNLDPEKAGRIKVRVYGVYDDIEKDHIPWAEYADTMMQGQSQFGGFFVPDIGSKVWVFFEAGNHMLPVYFAGAPSHLDMPSERKDSTYPHNRVFRTKSGHVIEIDDSPGEERIRIKHRSGTQKTIFANGDVEEVVVGNVIRTVMGNVEETIEGNFVTSIMGSRTEQSGNGSEYLSADVIDINGTVVNIN